MAVVVWCPACRGASRVGPEAVGQLVVCPRCDEPFLAAPEVSPEPPPPPRRRERRPRPEPAAPPPERPAAPPVDPHDTLPVVSTGLPVSVLVGLALLPFTIPFLWLLGPHVVGHAPALSVAAPAALAVAAAALCLAVVYTVDWAPATRIKGVLMLVGLAYFAGLSLYFMKKEMVEHAKDWFGPARDWQNFRPAGETYQVALPRPHPRVAEADGRSLPGWTLTTYHAAQADLGGRTEFAVGAGTDPPRPGRRTTTREWFEGVERALLRANPGGQLEAGPAVRAAHGDDCREWTLQFPNSDTTHVIRVYRVNGRVYYLSAVGHDLDHDLAERFFQSFQILPPKG